MPNHEPFFVSNHLLQQAEQMCKLRLAKDPDNPSAVAALAKVYRKEGKLDEALTLYKRLTVLKPEDREAEYMHAILAGIDVPVRTGMRPAPFVFVKNFLPPSFHEHLVPFVLSIQEQMVPALVGNDLYNPDAR